MKYGAYVMLSLEPQKHEDAYRHLSDIPGVKSAYQTAGQWDAVLWVEGSDYPTLCKTVIDKIRRVEGVRRSETLFAFDRI